MDGCLISRNGNREVWRGDWKNCEKQDSIKRREVQPVEEIGWLVNLCGYERTSNSEQIDSH